MNGCTTRRATRLAVFSNLCFRVESMSFNAARSLLTWCGALPFSVVEMGRQVGQQVDAEDRTRNLLDDLSNCLDLIEAGQKHHQLQGLASVRRAVRTPYNYKI